jgi:ABC-type phosphate transport system substrate-binding protein
MTKLMITALVCVLHLLGANVARAQTGFVVIVNQASTVSTLKRGDVSKLFMRRLTKWSDGQEVQPVDQVASSQIRRIFSDSIHHMDVPRVKNYWQLVVFSGRGDPPPERASDEDIIQFVRTTPTAIGYVSASAAIVDVKIVAIKQ